MLLEYRFSINPDSLTALRPDLTNATAVDALRLASASNKIGLGDSPITVIVAEGRDRPLRNRSMQDYTTESSNDVDAGGCKPASTSVPLSPAQ